MCIEQAEETDFPILRRSYLVKSVIHSGEKTEDITKTSQFFLIFVQNIDCEELRYMVIISSGGIVKNLDIWL